MKLYNVIKISSGACNRKSLLARLLALWYTCNLIQGERMKKVLFAMMFVAMWAPLLAATRPAPAQTKSVSTKATSSRPFPKKPTVPVKVYKSNRKLAQERNSR